MTQQLAGSNHLLEALREEAAELASQLSAAQASLAAKDKLIQQLKDAVGTAAGAGRWWCCLLLVGALEHEHAVGHGRAGTLCSWPLWVSKRDTATLGKGWLV